MKNSILTTVLFLMFFSKIYAASNGLDDFTFFLPWKLEKQESEKAEPNSKNNHSDKKQKNNSNRYSSKNNGINSEVSNRYEYIGIVKNTTSGCLVDIYEGDPNKFPVKRSEYNEPIITSDFIGTVSAGCIYSEIPRRDYEIHSPLQTIERSKNKIIIFSEKYNVFTKITRIVVLYLEKGQDFNHPVENYGDEKLSWSDKFFLDFLDFFGLRHYPPSD